MQSSDKIALLVPTRNRINNVLTLLSSLMLTTSDSHNIHVYFCADADDPNLATLQGICDKLNWAEVVINNETGKFIGVGKLWNICAEKALTDGCQILAMIGDDMIFKTRKWDLRIISLFGQSDDKLIGVYCNDECHRGRLAVNFFIHRKYLDLKLTSNGKFVREEFKVNWIDTWLERVFRSCHRLVYRDDIVIEHRHWILGKNEKDMTADRMLADNTETESDEMWKKLSTIRVQDAILLGKAINYIPETSKNF